MSAFYGVKVLSLSFLLMVCACVGSAYAQEVTKEQLQTRYMDFLKAEGYVPSVDSDGDVRFKAEGRNYYIKVDENDPAFFTVVFPNFWEIEDPSEKQRALEAANEITLEIKAVKVCVIQENVVATVELFLPDDDDFSKVFARVLNVIKAGVDRFAEKMRA